MSDPNALFISLAHICDVGRYIDRERGEERKKRWNKKKGVVCVGIYVEQTLSYSVSERVMVVAEGCCV